MTWHPSPWSIAGIAAWVVAWYVAYRLYRAAPQRSVNRRLALVLLAEGLAEGTGFGLMYLIPSKDVAYAVMRVCYAAAILLPALYLYFLSSLESPLAVPLRGRWVRGILFAGVIAAEIYALIRPGDFFWAPVHTWYAPWDCPYGEKAPLVFMWNAVASIYGFLVAGSAYLTAPKESTIRTRSRWVAIAFGTRDVLYIGLCLQAAGAANPTAHYNPWDVVACVGLPITTLVFIVLLGFGILRTQILEIELRMKWGISRSSLVLVFVAAFVVGQEIVKSYLSTLDPTLGGIAAGVLAFVLIPVQRLTDRLANAVMPSVNDSDEYFRFKKLEMYKAAVESSIEDRRELPGPTERRLLDRLRDRLGLTSEVARAIEADTLRIWNLVPSAAPALHGL